VIVQGGKDCKTGIENVREGVKDDEKDEKI